MNNMEEVLGKRLEELGINPYEISRRVAAAEGDETQKRRIYSRVARAIASPESSRLTTLQGIVRAMNGEIIIRWNKTEEVTL